MKLSGFGFGSFLSDLASSFRAGIHSIVTTLANGFDKYSHTWTLHSRIVSFSVTVSRFYERLPGGDNVEGFITNIYEVG